METTRIGKWVLMTVLSAAVLGCLGADEAFAHRWGVRHHHHRHHYYRHTVGCRIVVGTPVRVVTPVYVSGKSAGSIDFDVEPDTTQVYVDGALRGTVDDFDGFPQHLKLRPGNHSLTLRTPEGVEVTKDIRITAGTKIKIKLELDH